MALSKTPLQQWWSSDSTMTTKNPFFSVIVPVYNKENVLSSSIKSILNQSFKDFELIIVCDPSTDKSNEVVKRFKDPRIKIYYRDEPGPGGYAARNLGIEKSKAKWVAFLDADDIWSKEHLNTAFISIKNNSFDFLTMNYSLIREGKERVNSEIKKEKIVNRKEMLLLQTQKDMIHTNSIVAKKEDLIKVGMFPAGRYKRGGDNDLWLRLILNSKKIMIHPETTSYYYTDHSGVIANKSNLGSVHPVRETSKKHLEQEKNKEISTLVKKFANRKTYSWIMERKSSGIFNIKEVKNYFFEPRDKNMYKYVAVSILPTPLIRILKRLKGKL